eukprot:scaffold153469_cov32-Tisochrysis_lutea.AAC.6
MTTRRAACEEANTNGRKGSVQNAAHGMIVALEPRRKVFSHICFNSRHPTVVLKRCPAIALHGKTSRTEMGGEIRVVSHLAPVLKEERVRHYRRRQMA